MATHRSETSMNAGERGWMRSKVRPPGLGCRAEAFARGGGTPPDGTDDGVFTIVR
jgi:hypothetical protein